MTARYAAPDLIAKRAQVSSDIATALRAKLALYGAQVINIDMRNFAFNSDYMRAISEKVTQEQLRLGAENKLRTVEPEQKQKVAIAEAEASALRAKADGDAYANLKVATAQAEALKGTSKNRRERPQFQSRSAVVQAYGEHRSGEGQGGAVGWRAAAEYLCRRTDSVSGRGQGKISAASTGRPLR